MPCPNEEQFLVKNNSGARARFLRDYVSGEYNNYDGVSDMRLYIDDIKNYQSPNYYMLFTRDNLDRSWGIDGGAPDRDSLVGPDASLIVILRDSPVSASRSSRRTGRRRRRRRRRGNKGRVFTRSKGRRRRGRVLTRSKGRGRRG